MLKGTTVNDFWGAEEIEKKKLKVLAQEEKFNSYLYVKKIQKSSRNLRNSLDPTLKLIGAPSPIIIFFPPIPEI